MLLMIINQVAFKQLICTFKRKANSFEVICIKGRFKFILAGELSLLLNNFVYFYPANQGSKKSLIYRGFV